MSANPVGRPPIPEERVKELQELYLELLAAGKKEREVDAVEGMVARSTRQAWELDAEFSVKRKDAMRRGVVHRLEAVDEKIEAVFQKAWDDAASPQLVSATKLMADQEKWRASRLNEDYADKTVNKNENKNTNLNASLTELEDADDDKVKQAHAILFGK